MTRKLDRPCILFPEDNGKMARRRLQLRGCLRQRGRTWYLEWWEYHRDITGKVKARRAGQVIGLAVGKGAITEREARREADRRVLRRVDEANRNPCSLATVHEYVEAKFQPNHVWALTPGGKAHYERILRLHVLPALGHLRLRDVNRDRVQCLIRERMDARALGTQTARHIRNVVGKIFREAQMDGFFDGAIPTQGVKIPARPGRVRQALDAASAKQLIWRLPSPYREMAFTLAVTGLRIGELCALRWRDLDFERRYLHVRESYDPTHGRTLPKQASTGDVPMPDALVIILQQIKACSCFTAPDDPVFAARSGKPIDRHNAQNRYIRPAARELGLEASWHSFRHTLATLSKERGARPEDRMAVLRHRSPEMARHYAHGDPEAMRGIMDAIALELMPDQGEASKSEGVVQ